MLSVIEALWTSGVLPRRPLEDQAASYGVHLSPSLRAPARHQTHLDSHHFPDNLPYVCHSLWFLPQALLFLFHVCVLLVFLVLYYVTFILLKHSLPELASRLSAHIVTVEVGKPTSSNAHSLRV
jgi:hypothetical protein